MARPGIIDMLSRGGTGLLCTVLALPLAADDLAVGSLHIETTPPGAEVFLIGGRAGHTPLDVSERAVYPNDYPDDQAHLYGTVTLRHAGCTPRVHRVTLEDIELGLHVKLDCATNTVPMVTPAEVTAPTVTSSPMVNTGIPAHIGESVSQRRLRQLQVLQELLDEGLISDVEERRIRRQLLEMQ